MISSEFHGENDGSFETTVFFAAIAIAAAFLLVLLLYINHKWRPVMTTLSPIQCCEEFLMRNKIRKSLVIAQQNRHELISLAEKGRVQSSSNNNKEPGSGSSSCSTTSADDEPRRGLKALRHRESRASSSNHQHALRDTQQVEIANSAMDHCVTIQDQESALFDVTDLQSDFGPEREETNKSSSSVGKCGSLEVAFAFDAPMRKMTVHVLQARGIPERASGGYSHTQVRLLLLPRKKQKHKTKIRSGEMPQFMDSFLFHRVNPEDVNSMGVRFRLYGCERMRREKMIGEAAVSFAALNLELETTMWLTLEPQANPAVCYERATRLHEGTDDKRRDGGRKEFLQIAYQTRYLELTSPTSFDLLSLTHRDSICSNETQQHGGVPELLLGLAYSANTGRLAVEVVKGSHLSLCEPYRHVNLPRPPDTYVKLCLVSSSGQELGRCKTSVRRGQPNPLYKETFAFQVALFQLFEVTLMVSVYTKRSMKRREMIGWFCLGLHSSGEEELNHWSDMKEANGEQLCRWHILADS